MTDQQPTMLANRLRKRAKHLRKWAKREGISCYRLYDRDIPEIPLAVDWYEGRLHIAEYQRNHDHTPEEHEAWLDSLVDAAAEVLQVERADCYLKRRERQKGTAQYERVSKESAIFTVREWGATFEVNLSDYLDTGLFLDHRLTRRRVAAEARGKDVLNLFAYTGAFTVHAAMGGARSTTTVDLSNTYLDWAESNLRLNTIAPSDHRVVRDDVMAWLRRSPPESYDLVVCDPPTFSNSKRTLTHFDIQRDQLGLLSAVARVTRPTGVVYFSTNFRRFKPEFEATGPGGVWETVDEISGETVPEDFRNKRVHRCWRLVRGTQGVTL